MPITSAERQRQYREKALKAPCSLLLARLQVMLTPHAYSCLERLCKATGQTKRQVVEYALVELEKHITP